MIKKLLAVCTGAAAAGALLASCSTNPGATQAAVTYAPAAYGVAGHCYYISYPAEATDLIAAGLCPRTWVPTPAPLAWQEEYYDYYDSDAYLVYVPATNRAAYRSTQTVFYTRYKVSIVGAEKSAVYKGSNGSTVKGYSASRVKFSGGNAGSGLLGGGSARGGTSIHGCSENDTVIALRTGSYTGGSARGGTSITAPTSRPTPRPAATSKGC